MKSKSSKLVRFLIWASASKDNKEDALSTFEERHDEVTKKFGASYAAWWSLGQGLRSLPYGFIGIILKVTSIIFRIGK